MDEPIALPIVSSSYDGRPRKLFPLKCRKCSSIFFVPKHTIEGKKFCSPKCSSEARSTKIIHNCKGCGNDFLLTKKRLDSSKTKNNFCSRTCKDFEQRVGGSLLTSSFKGGTNSYRRRALRDLGKKCNVCSYDEHEQMLDVDHIDGNRKNPSMDNLQVLCVWCHALKTRGVEGHERPSQKSPPRPKIEWPSDEVMGDLVWVQTIKNLAIKFGVTATCISKHCKSRGIETPPPGYWSNR